MALHRGADGGDLVRRRRHEREPRVTRLAGPFGCALTVDVEEWYHTCLVPGYVHPELRPQLSDELDRLFHALADTTRRAMVERLCSEAGFSPDFAYTVDDVTVARGLVAAGLTVAVMPEAEEVDIHIERVVDDAVTRRWLEALERGEPAVLVKALTGGIDGKWYFNVGNDGPHEVSGERARVELRQHAAEAGRLVGDLADVDSCDADFVSHGQPGDIVEHRPIGVAFAGTYFPCH